jgi:arginine deiminase
MDFGCQSMTGRIETILIKHPENAFISQKNLDNGYEAYGYIGCPEYEMVTKEYETFESIIKNNVQKILYLPFDERAGIDSIYTHDTVKITNKGAIYFPMGKGLRKGEPEATRAYLESIGVPTLGVIESPARIEGGDVVWLDEKTVAIGRGYRTNEQGIKRFKEITQGIVEEIIIVPMPHGDGEGACLHLMSIISLVDKDLAVVYSKYMPVFFREYLIEKGIELIETPDQEYDYLGTNVLALAPRKCVLVKGNTIVKDKLESAGAEVFEYDGHELSYRGTGGPTCLTCPIFRR